MLDSGIYYIGFNPYDGERALILNVDSTTLVGQGKYNTWLYATLDLWAPMMVAEADNFTVTALSFNGMGYARDEADQCIGDDREGGSNILAHGTGYVFDDMQSVFALCGTALGVDGIDFSITNSRFIGNGMDSGPGPDPWSDAITVWWCDGAEIGNNYIMDATDIGIVVGGGEGCGIRYNTIENLYSLAFAGIHIGYFGGYYGDHETIDYEGNTLFSNINKMQFGIVAGFHPWDGDIPVDHSGEIFNNEVEGAVVNFAVDGVGGGAIYGNTSTSPQGTDGYGSCTASNHYTAGHYSGMSLQAGVTWVSMTYDNGSCS